MKLRPALLLLCPALLAALCPPALGCSVCSGDAESPMAKGVVAGVFVMVGIVGFVLLGIVGTTCLFFVRSRRLQLLSPRGEQGS